MASSVDCWLTFASFRCLAQLRWSLDQVDEELDFVLSQTCLGAVTAVSRGVRRWEILFYMQTGTINCINWTFNFSQQYQGSALEQYIHLFESIKPAAHTTSKISNGRPDSRGAKIFLLCARPRVCAGVIQFWHYIDIRNILIVNRAVPPPARGHTLFEVIVTAFERKASPNILNVNIEEL